MNEKLKEYLSNEIIESKELKEVIQKLIYINSIKLDNYSL